MTSQCINDKPTHQPVLEPLKHAASHETSMPHLANAHYLPTTLFAQNPSLVAQPACFFDEPASVVQQLGHRAYRYCLFLDIDGTLADFCDDPEHSFIPQKTLTAIHTIQQCQVPVIAVTGRQVAVAQQLFDPLVLPVAGLHGLDIVVDHNYCLSPDLSLIDFAGLRQSLVQACTEYPRLLLEDKQHSFALHYRQCPELEPVAHDIMQQLLHDQPHMKLNYGKCVVEILPLQADKGHAIQCILAHFAQDTFNQEISAHRATQTDANSTRIPLFIGDDITDESGFSAVNAVQGISIKVGTGTTKANYRLQDTSAVTEFLIQFHQLLQDCAAMTDEKNCTQAQDGEPACQN